MRGGRGRGGGRSRSTRDKDQRSGRRPDPFPNRPRRSLSPPLWSRPQQSPSRRRASPDLREYVPGRSDHGKQAHGRPAPFEEEGYGFPHKYMLEHPAEPVPDVNPGSNPSRSNRDSDFHHQSSVGLASASSGLSGQGMLIQNSMFLDDGTARKFYTMPRETGYLSSMTPLKSENTGGSEFRETLRYNDRPSEPYDERDRGTIYSKDTSFPLIPSSQARTFGGTSSSSLAKDDLLDLYRDRPHHPSDGFSRTIGVSKLSDDYAQHNSYGQGLVSDPIRRPLSPLARDGPRDYMYPEFDRNKRSDQGSLAADNLYKNVQWGNRGDFKDVPATSSMGLARDRVDGAVASHKNSSESSLWEKPRSLHRDAAMGYRDMREIPEDYVSDFRNGHAASRMKLSRDNEAASFNDRYTLVREAAPMAYRERPRSPLLSDRQMDMSRHGVRPSQGISHMGDIGIYELSSERMVRGKYAMDDDVNHIDSRGTVSNDRSAFRRLQSPSGSAEMWSIEDRVDFQPSKRLAYGEPQHRMSTNRVPRSNRWLPSDDFSAHKEGGRSINLKRRLSPGPSDFHGSFPLEKRRNDFSRPYKFWKKGFEDRFANLDAHHGDAYDNDPPLPKTDPPEDSEEFKHLVHKAFLRFSKLLNETPHQQKRYREQGKAGSLICCVCGSLSKEFVDTRSLATHAYNSLKVGLRTNHLGLHKALCVLMGWNLDNVKFHQSIPMAEAKALKEDLILWPPVVIIHHSSIGNKNNADEAKVVTIEGMKEILRDMGFESGKTRVSQGKPANQSVFLIKFMPTFSGLQEAERLHKHYVDNGRGRQEFQRITSSNGDDRVKEAEAEKAVMELLYGYMAVAEDLGKLDTETKKRSLVKSRKDIEAIADAPLNTE